MSGSHDKLPKLFWIQLILVAIVGTLYLLAPKAEKHTAEASETNQNVQTAAKNLEPVGTVTAKSDDTSNGPSAARSGEEVYKASCMACHAAGVANAPKPSDKAAWEPRVATGLDALMKTAIDGKGAMPARGGNPAITDEEIKASILFMTSEAGFDLSSSEKSDSMPEKKEVETSAPTETKTPATETVEVPAAPTAPAAPAAPEVATSVAAAATDTTAPIDNVDGEKIYKSACFACHDAGVAGSPKIGDIPAWTARIATGTDALYFSAINGKGVMPPKGGNMGLSDPGVKAAVDYIVAKSQ